MLKKSFYNFCHLAKLSNGGFNCKSIRKLNDFNLELIEYEHSTTNAKFIQIKTDDKNNVFSANFRSRVSDSKGTPHILEHLICCGSKKYPVKDPFMAMSKKSLNTFMNAWTGPDFIGFPFASTNEKDFINLLDVYLDLIFEPLLNKLDFHQEGWRLDISTEPEIKGVVFNEMKGYYQSPESIFHQYILSNILKETEYQHMYGGDPQQIPTLQHQELIEYYKNTINPSSPVFYFYGDKLSTQIMQKIGQYLTKIHPTQTFNKQIPQFNNEQQNLLLPPNIDQNSVKDSYFALSYKLKESLIDDPIQNTAFNIIHSVLFEQSTGLLYKELIDSGIAEGFVNMTGLETYGDFSLFHFALKGIEQDKKHGDLIESIIYKTLNNLVENGFPQDLVDCALHQEEIQFKMPSAEQGMKILEHLLGHIIHKKDIMNALEFSTNIAQLKNRISQGYLQQLVKDNFLNNEYKVKVYAQPNEEFLNKLDEEENNIVNNMVANLNSGQLEEIKIQNDELFTRQNDEQNFSVLPQLTLQDIVLKKEEIQSHQVFYEKVPINFVHEKTNGITFIKLKVNTGSVTQGIRQYLEMYCNIITRIGTERFKHDTVAKLLNLSSTAFNAKLDSICDPYDVLKTNTFITFSIACLDSKLDSMVDIFSEILSEPYFKDQENLSSIFRNLGAQYQNDLLDNSLTYAQFLANQSLSESQHIKDINFSTRFLLNLSSKFLSADNQSKYLYIDDFNFQMVNLMNFIFKQNNLSFMVHSGQIHQSEQGVRKIIDALKQKFQGFDYSFSQSESQFKPTFQKLVTTLPSQVNFSVAGVQIPHFTHTDTSKLLVLGSLLSNTVLHSKIREQGGAYGAGCSVSALKGVLNLWSYRDPNILDTLNVFKSLGKLEYITDEQLNDAKFTVFQRLDRPIDPQDKGVNEIFYGITNEIQNKIRENIIQTKIEDIREVCDKYIGQQFIKDQYSIGVFASNNHSDITLLQDGFDVREFLGKK